MKARRFNQYGVMLVNPAKRPGVKKALGLQLIDWLVSPEGQRAIANYEIRGQQLFLPQRQRSRGVRPAIGLKCMIALRNEHPLRRLTGACQHLP